MNYEILKTLLETHPNWPSEDNSVLAAWANEEVVNVTKTELPNEEILSVILTNRAEFSALSDSDKQIVRDILYIGDTVPTEAGKPARDTLVSIFGAQSDTIQTLAGAISYTISRAADVGIIGAVSDSDVSEAKRRAGV